MRKVWQFLYLITNAIPFGFTGMFSFYSTQNPGNMVMYAVVVTATDTYTYGIEPSRHGRCFYENPPQNF